MKIALVFPPTADPTAPYLSLPLLAACLRGAGHEVLLRDVNLEAYEALLRPDRLGELSARLERKLQRLEARPALDHEQQLAYAALWSARGEAAAVPATIEGALATLRDRSGERFYDPRHYEDAVATVEGALRLVGAAYHPLELSFAGYRTPFSLLDLDAIAGDARDDRDPFFRTFAALGEELHDAAVELVGLSVVFPGQLQPAFALAASLRRAMPEVPVLAGGPAITQLLLGLDPTERERALGPFSAAVVFEGEEALLELLARQARGEGPRGIILGTQGRDLADLPAPDFDGLPLERYLSPEPVLPYDLSRGCYWGRCAFCHYGLAAHGTACYRERPVEAARAHLAELARKHHSRLFYLSQDSVAPRTLLGLARALREAGDGLRWSTDLRPERFFDEERSRELAAGGALSVSLGVESASPRLLRLIDKGISAPTMRRAVSSLAAAGVATELMCFTDFPTETGAEALATLRFLEQERDRVSLFVCGQFALTHGARVAAEPEAFGVKETWRVRGDKLGTGLFYDEARPSKSDEDRAAVESALDRLSRRWRLRRYPWAGSLSTAHSMLWFARFGPGVFKELADDPAPRPRGAPWRTATARFDVERAAKQSAEREGEIWSSLIYERRRVSPAAYRALARATPSLRPRPRRWRYAAGRAPSPAPLPRPKGKR